MEYIKPRLKGKSHDIPKQLVLGCVAEGQGEWRGGRGRRRDDRAGQGEHRDNAFGCGNIRNKCSRGDACTDGGVLAEVGPVLAE